MAGHCITVVAQSSLGQMTVLKPENNPLLFELPKLPEAIIEMVIASNPHPNFGCVQLLEVCKL